MKKTLILYGILLAILIALLRYLEYSYLVRNMSLDIYISIIAILFTALGIWLAIRFLKSKNPTDIFYFDLHSQNSPVAEDYKISSREIEVLQLLAQGYSNQEIADRLYVSLNKVKSHTFSLYTKLNVKRRTAAIRKARELNILS